jgi:hypothetical protein
MDFKEIEFNVKSWMDLAQDKDYYRTLVNMGSIGNEVN